MKLLPKGVASFPALRHKDFLYADKTRLLYELVKLQQPFFLSRPRRFGKSLTVSALKAILEGRRELFKGLWIDSSDYDWRPYPVIHLSLSSVDTHSLDSVKKDLLERLKIIAECENLSFNVTSPDNLASSDDVASPDNLDNPIIFFLSLIAKLYYKYDRSPVAILIDEYDAPILSEISQPKLADQIRQLLKKFYGVLKDSEEYRGFTFITGVTRFTKTSIFSELNNLSDLTLNRKFASICGFTIDEFDTLFQEHMEQALDELKTYDQLAPEATIADLRSKILEWYDGYSWDGVTRVLNPWSLLGFFFEVDFSNYWFESGTPTFLVDLIRSRRMDLNFFKADNFISKDLNNVEVADFKPGPLMFQTGYLTIQTGASRKRGVYNLVFPNLEVKASLAPLLLSLEKPMGDQLLMKRQALAVKACLFKRDALCFQAAFENFISNFPYQVLMAREFFYQSLLISAMALADQYFESELSVGGGRIDLHLKEPQGDDYVIEIKYRQEDEDLEKKIQEAFDQIEVRKYHLKFQGAENRIWKTALVIGGARDVNIRFELASNWILKLNDLFFTVKEPSKVAESETPV